MKRQWRDAALFATVAAVASVPMAYLWAGDKADHGHAGFLVTVMAVVLAVVTFVTSLAGSVLGLALQRQYEPRGLALAAAAAANTVLSLSLMLSMPPDGFGTWMTLLVAIQVVGAALSAAAAVRWRRA